jgi:hypothetical protein
LRRWITIAAIAAKITIATETATDTPIATVLLSETTLAARAAGDLEVLPTARIGDATGVRLMEVFSSAGIPCSMPLMSAGEMPAHAAANSRKCAVADVNVKAVDGSMLSANNVEALSRPNAKSSLSIAC